MNVKNKTKILLKQCPALTDFWQNTKQILERIKLSNNVCTGVGSLMSRMHRKCVMLIALSSANLCISQIFIEVRFAEYQFLYKLIFFSSLVASLILSELFLTIKFPLQNYKKKGLVLHKKNLWKFSSPFFFTQFG